MKCQACQEYKCERKYVPDRVCHDEDGNECTCVCQVSPVEDVLTTALSVGCGTAAIVGGVAVALLNKGPTGVESGKAALNSGTSLVMNPIQKQIEGERISMSDTLEEINTSIGALAEPLGEAVSSVSQGASDLVKMVTGKNDPSLGDCLQTLGGAFSFFQKK